MEVDFEFECSFRWLRNVRPGSPDEWELDLERPWWFLFVSS